MTGFPEHGDGEDTDGFFVVSDQNYRHVLTFFNSDRASSILRIAWLCSDSCMALSAATALRSIQNFSPSSEVLFSTINEACTLPSQPPNRS